MTKDEKIAIGVIAASAVGILLIKLFGYVNVELVAGGNTIVFQGSTREIAPAFVGYEDKIQAVWYQDPDTGNFLGYSPSAPEWANDLKWLIQGATYEITAIVNCVWSYLR